MLNAHSIAVVIPSYRVIDHILSVITQIGPEVDRIYVVDDCCPQESGQYVEKHAQDSRIKVLYHNKNQGVGGAVMTGYKAALEESIDIIVKIDGDGQMDPSLLIGFVTPIINGEADYSKGNRFFNIDALQSMPGMRLFGNAALSFMTKLSSGYWNLFDPTNGYTAIHKDALTYLPFNKISTRYFFETDILFRLNTLRAAVVDIPMDSVYKNEVSNLKISRVIGEFFIKHCRNFFKRIFYNYYLRDMSVASFEMPLGFSLLVFGLSFGGYHWFKSMQTGQVATVGTVMIAALSIIIGIQFLLAFLAYDIASTPTRSIRRPTLPFGESPKQ